MSAKSPNIDGLRIATPCPVSWDQMTGDNRVRFCDHCRLNVYNIAELSKLEAQSLIASTEGRICARLFRRADGTVLTKDCPVGLRALRRRVSKRVAAVLATVAGISNLGFGQSAASKDQKITCTPQTRITRKHLRSDEVSSLAGTLFDVNGAAIPGATISIENISSNKTITKTTDDQGTYRFDRLEEGTYSLKIEAIGFKHHQVKEIVLDRNQFLNIDMTLELSDQSVTVGILALTSWIDTSSSATTTTITGDHIRRLPIPQ